MNTASILPKALAGHIIDLYRIATWTFRNPHSYSKFRALNEARKRTGATTLIEVGTFRGLTAKRCARVFESVKTIELDEQLSSEAANFLRPCSNVEVIQGDGLIEIVKIFERSEIDGIIVFLDGHFSGGVTALSDLAEPAVEELAVLSRFRDRICGIIIDDFREFGSEKGWPKKWEIIRAAEELFADYGYDVTVYLDQIVIIRK